MDSTHPARTPVARPELLLLSAILLIAAALRLWGIGFGLPYIGITYDYLSIEEIQEVHRALKLGAGEYAWVFGKGGLYLLLFVEYGALFATWWALGIVEGPKDFAVRVLEDPTALYMIGRVTVAFMGVATCLIVYLIARRLYDARVALATALIGATSYFHAAYSAVINVDIGCTLALWLSVLLYLRFEETQRIRQLAGAGALGAAAIAFKLPGAMILPLLGAALATSPPARHSAKWLFRNGAVLVAALLVSLTIIAPEWLLDVKPLLFTSQPAVDSAPQGAAAADIAADIASITIERTSPKARYLEHLLKGYNLPMFVAAIVGALMGIMRRRRWEVLFFGLVASFIAIMSLSDRTQAERYLLPVMPALWLLAGRAVMSLGYKNRILALGALGVVVAVPAWSLVRVAVEKTGTDTRIAAKEWIESRVPDGSRILMDGSRYRFAQNAPLNLDEQTVARRIERVTEAGGRIGRGVSPLALSVYEEALARAAGPKYRLESTVYGLEVRDLDHYVASCFDYIVTSSIIAGRFAEGGRARDGFPDSARFYDSLEQDARVTLVHEEAPVPWRKSGPVIRVYRITADNCAHPAE